MKKHLFVMIAGLGLMLNAGASCAAMSYTAPSAISQPRFDESVLESYNGAVPGVHVSFTVDADGSVSDISLLESTGDGAVDAAIIESVRTWRYTPATDDTGNPVAAGVTQYIDID